MKRDNLNEKMRALVERRTQPLVNSPDVPLVVLIEEAYLLGIQDTIQAYKSRIKEKRQ